MWHGWTVRPALATLVGIALSAACADDGAAPVAAETGTSSTGSPSPTTGESSAGPDTTTTTAADTLDVTFEITTYDTQPMVADLAVTSEVPVTVTVRHRSDSGVIVSPLGDEPGPQRFRARGLLPDTSHEFAYEATADDGRIAEGTFVFDTPAALPAFVGAFAVEGTRVPAAPLYRLSDYNPFPFGDFAGAIMIDASGITRWFLSAPTTLAGPQAVWVGLKLRADGTIAYLQGDSFFIRDELGEIVAEIPATDLGLSWLHHDVHELPSGNLMALSRTYREIDYPDLGPTLVCGDLLVEFTLEGEVVWTWDAFDHLDPMRRRDGFDDPLPDPVTGEVGNDWTHGNGFIVDERQGTITLSLRHQDWIVQLDRVDGDVLWRLGDGGDFALREGDRWFFHQHSPQWQPDGSLLLYDNGNGNPEVADDDVHSRAVRIALDTTGMTASLAWQDDEAPFATVFAGDADRIEGGHILVTDSSIFNRDGMNTRYRELDPQRVPQRIWTAWSPPNRWSYRTTAHTGLVGEPLR